MKKKILTMCLVVALAATAIVGGTLAYFTDSDADVNVMTSGNVHIKQDEWQSNEENTAYKEFENGKALFPYTGPTNSETGIASEYNANLFYPYGIDGNDENHWGDSTGNVKAAFSNKNNAVDKIVTVTNTGNTPVYFRTLFAFEIARDKEDKVISPFADDKLNYAVMGLDQLKWHEDVIIKVNDVEFMIGEFYYKYNKATENLVEGQDPLSSLDPKTTSYPSLTQIYLNSKVDNEWYEIFGQHYNIIALSQATQMNGFISAKSALDKAFAEIKSENKETIQSWFIDNIEDDVIFVETVHGVIDSERNTDAKDLKGTDMKPVADIVP